MARSISVLSASTLEPGMLAVVLACARAMPPTVPRSIGASQRPAAYPAARTEAEMSVCVDSTRTRDALVDEGGLYGAAQALRSAVHKSMCSLTGRGMSCMTTDYRGDPAPWKLNLQSIQMARRFVAPLLAPLKQRLS